MRSLNAARPECFPRTRLVLLSPTDSGVMISYVSGFFSTPSWWMPASCANALAPTIALLGWTIMPV